jgi:hypothetical protein
VSSILDHVKEKPIGDALEAIADEVESAESTAWWRRDAAERRVAAGEDIQEGEAGPGLDNDEFRRRFAYLFRSTGAA